MAAGRQEKMKEQLRRIRALPGLSADTLEVTTRALGTLTAAKL